MKELAIQFFSRRCVNMTKEKNEIIDYAKTLNFIELNKQYEWLYARDKANDKIVVFERNSLQFRDFDVDRDDDYLKSAIYGGGSWWNYLDISNNEGIEYITKWLED